MTKKVVDLESDHVVRGATVINWATITLKESEFTGKARRSFVVQAESLAFKSLGSKH